MSGYRIITKSEALRLLEKERERYSGNNFSLPKENNPITLYTGAKLFARKIGSVIRYGVYGYAYDGKDISDLF